jgi:hypothetical protein
MYFNKKNGKTLALIVISIIAGFYLGIYYSHKGFISYKENNITLMIDKKRITYGLPIAELRYLLMLLDAKQMDALNSCINGLLDSTIISTYKRRSYCPVNSKEFKTLTKLLLAVAKDRTDYLNKSVKNKYQSKKKAKANEILKTIARE